MNLEQIGSGQDLAGIEPSDIVKVIAVVPVGDSAVQLIYRTPDGQMKERLLNRQDEAGIVLATARRSFSFAGDGAAFQLACEAKRIDLAFLFDPMMAVHTSNVDPLPHQITAVYESMLPRQPLRFVLADDPGAGKTIMAGLYIRELIMRADSERILIVAPGSLVEQWRDELFDKFGLEFRIYSAALEEATPSGNPFQDYSQLIVRLDQISRNEDLQGQLCGAGWDLAIFDEAHKLAAHYFGSELKKTERFKFAERLGAHARHLLLMTATPHNGKDEDFQLFLSLLDADRFYGRFRDGVHKVDPSDLMRRMVKEELLKFDGRPLFPERRAYTVNYPLSPREDALYQAVTRYVTTEMGKADDIGGSRKGSVGFALTALQRRLASSPEAIFHSLRRRRERLENRLTEMKKGVHFPSPFDEDVRLPEDDDDLNAEEQENLEETLVDEATASMTLSELSAEIDILKGLQEQARELVQSGEDRKWDELSKIIQNNPEMHDASGRQRKIILFSEHRDTLNYLKRKIAGVLGRETSIVTIDGKTKRKDRLAIQAQFRSDPEIRVLIATDAAGEGVNLQVASLMVNYDLPWNPNRLEQRFGRIHRIGQTEVCHLWNLVSSTTREGAVYHRLLDKLATEKDALKGKVFDILGEVFEERSLKDLLLEAIRYGDRPEIRAKLTKQIDQALDQQHLLKLLDNNALAQETMTKERLFAVKEEMDRAEARRLQPYFIRSFFLKAFENLGGTVYSRELGRHEITHVPTTVRERDRRISGRNRRIQEPVLKRYERICFEREAIQPVERPGLARAVLMHPGQPLMLSMTDMILEQHSTLLRQGSVLVDPGDEGLQPWLLFLLTHEVKDGEGRVISSRMQFVKVTQTGEAEFAGWAPHLDLEPLPAQELPIVKELLSASWVTGDIEKQAIAMAASNLVPEHFQEVAGRRMAHVEKTLSAIHARLTREISFWQDRWMKLKEDQAAGKDTRLNTENVRRTIVDLEGRLENRKRQLQAMRHVVNSTPVVMGTAFVIPQGMMNTLRGDEPIDQLATQFASDPAARSRIELLAMKAVADMEAARGWRVEDVSKKKCGWDITSYPPITDDILPEARHIEVKGRIKGASTVCVSRNEITYAVNQGEKFVLAIVLVGEDDQIDGPYYLRKPFEREPEWGVSSVNFEINALLQRAGTD